MVAPAAARVDQASSDATDQQAVLDTELDDSIQVGVAPFQQII